MALGIREEHEELRRAVQRWAEAHCDPARQRAALAAGARTPPPWWAELAAQGWLGLHVAARHGGQGFGFVELGVVIEELAHSASSGPAASSALALALADRAAVPSSAGTGVGLAPPLVGVLEGSTPAAVALPGLGSVEGVVEDGGVLSLTGVVRPVPAGGAARVLVVPASCSTAPDGEVWCVVELGGPGARAEPLESLDLLCPVAAVRLEDAPVPVTAQLAGVDARVARALALVVTAAECAGGTRWCLEVAARHARDRRQFGRPIGQFQAVKHRVADMLVAAEQTAALAWDAARAADSGDDDQLHLAAALAGARVLDAYVECAKSCIQVLGGMGFTWEHDAHLHLRRAVALRQLLGGGGPARRAAAGAASAGQRRRLATELPPEAEEIREAIRRLVRSVAAVEDRGARRRALVDEGLAVPHWPAPYGRGAGAVEQLVIEEELRAARVRPPHLGVGAWALPTIIVHGTEDQRQRWVRPTLLGELAWCQLFSEPDAGSDLAALSTRATRTADGWLLEGQKVWTSMAAEADLGICLARTDPVAPRHEGITYFVVDMRSEGVEVRPLQEITGAAMFNEVFLNGVPVPDTHVVGPVNGGWRLARTTLDNERVSMSSGAVFGASIEAVLRLLSDRPEAVDDPVVLDRLGGLLGEAHAVALLGERATARSLSGVEPGPEASVRKLLGAEHEQRVQELGLALLGPEGATAEDDAAHWSAGFLVTRCLTIAGGTSEIQRNVIGERLAGLPRDPEVEGRGR